MRVDDEGRTRSTVRLMIEVDLDQVPGWGYFGEDFQNHVQRMLTDTVGHYNPTVSLIESDRTNAGNEYDYPRY